MKKYRKHYYVKGMNTKYLTPLLCSPRMVRAPHSARSQELDLPGTMKEWRKDRDTENLGSVGLDSLMNTPQSPRLNMFIIYDWAGKQNYRIQLNEETGLSVSAETVRRDTVFRGKKPWWALSAYTVDRPEVGFASPMSLTWRKLWTPMDCSRYLRPGHGPALVNNA